MSALKLTITRVGLERFAATQEGGGLQVSSVGFTAQSFTAAPTLTALPGEHRRIDTIAGEAVGDSIVHVTIRDDAEVRYVVRGLGLFLADGTLFAAYGQADPIVEKSALTSLYYAIDIAFPNGDATRLVFGDTNFETSPATTERRGLVELATDAEMLAGIDSQRVPSVKTIAGAVSTWLANALAFYLPVSQRGAAYGVASLEGGKVPRSQISLTPADVGAVPPTRLIGVAGLLSGGSPLDKDVEISLTTDALKAAGVVFLEEQMLDGTFLYRRYSDGHIEMSGVSALPVNEVAFTLIFPLAFPTLCEGLWATIINSNQSNDGQSTVQEVTLAPDRATLFAQNHKSPTSDAAGGFRWFARGR